MTDTFKTLHQSQLPNVAAALYTVPAATATVVRSIKLVNASVTNGVEIILYINGVAGANEWARLALDEHQTAEWSGAIALATGESIRGVATVAAKITTTISGDEIS